MSKRPRNRKGDRKERQLEKDKVNWKRQRIGIIVTGNWGKRKEEKDVEINMNGTKTNTGRERKD